MRTLALLTALLTAGPAFAIAPARNDRFINNPTECANRASLDYPGLGRVLCP